MHVSVNELMLTSQKAALGAGVSEGASEDLGNVAVWLGARGFPVIEAVHNALLAAQSGTSVYGKATVNEHRVEWAPERAGQALSAALVGGACADLFSLVQMEEGGSATLRELDVPLLQLACFSKNTGTHSVPVCVRWFNQDSEIVFAMSGGVLQVLTQSGMPYAGGKFKFEASRRVEGSSDGLEKSIPKIEVDKSKTLSGYEVDETLWGKLKQWADLILVEPTTHSRALGAGAGLTDND